MKVSAAQTGTWERSDPESLIRRHQAGVWRYLRVLGCSPAEADDLVQETFLVMLRADFVDRGVGETWSFLQQTARYLHLDRYRSKRRIREELRADLTDELWAAQPDTAGQHWLDALAECLESLQSRSRRAVHLVYELEQSRVDAAAAMGMKENGLKTLLQRTRASLRECIQRRLP